MQLLEMITRQLTTVAILIVISSQTFASSECNGDENSNPEIIKCSQEAFDKIDKIINNQYQLLIKEKTNNQRKAIVKSQVSWIKYKEKYCTDVYDSVYPGQEASIDRLSCLTQITSTRLNEIIYLRTGVINDGFHKAASIINKKITNYDYGKAIAFFGGQGRYGDQWQTYAMENCSITLSLYNEDTPTCLARMEFQTPIN
jgi:uncharacterized protein YecT (DUF1311 family)